MRDGARIGVLGGTFDPIHLGHIESARAARAALSLDRVIVIPSRVPPHRHQQPVASPYHRFAMTSLAVNGVEGLSASDLELCAPGPSYTADTLARLHAQGLAPLQIFFITGADAFAEIETWSRFPEVLELAHFVVIARPGYELDMLRGRLPQLAGRMTAASATSGSGGETGIFLVPARTPDVSSTEIRRRIAAGESLKGFVPAPVEWHIVEHRLYRAGRLHGQD